MFKGLKLRQIKNSDPEILEEEGKMFLQNIGNKLPSDAASCSRKSQSSAMNFVFPNIGVAEG
jgi:hypothetical protein